MSSYLSIIVSNCSLYIFSITFVSHCSVIKQRKLSEEVELSLCDWKSSAKKMMEPAPTDLILWGLTSSVAAQSSWEPVKLLFLLSLPLKDE